MKLKSKVASESMETSFLVQRVQNYFWQNVVGFEWVCRGMAWVVHWFDFFGKSNNEFRDEPIFFYIR